MVPWSDVVFAEMTRWQLDNGFPQTSVLLRGPQLSVPSFVSLYLSTLSTVWGLRRCIFVLDILTCWKSEENRSRTMFLFLFLEARYKDFLEHVIHESREEFGDDIEVPQTDTSLSLPWSSPTLSQLSFDSGVAELSGLDESLCNFGVCQPGEQHVEVNCLEVALGIS